MTGHRFCQRPASGGRGELQTAVQGVGLEYIPVSDTVEHRRIGAPVAVDAISHTLDGIPQG